MRIHKEGHRLLLLTAVLLLLTNVVLWVWAAFPGWLLGGIAVLSILKLLFFLQFFRHPFVHLQAKEGVVYAPAEGKIVQIQETTEDEILKRRALQLSIFMSPFNVHVNRAPFEGQVMCFRYHKGKYLVAYHPKSSTHNERTSLLLQDKSGRQVLVRQIAGLVARRICYYIKEGDHIEAGKQFGFIKFGSRVDVFLPIGSKLLVEVGQRTTCATTPLAELPPPT